MEHAAHLTFDETSLPFAPVRLRLRQGSAERAVCPVSEAPGGSLLSVGSDDSCDWIIRSAMVPAHAFSVLLVAGNAFVRSGPEAFVRLDGHPLGTDWTPLTHGARLNVGLALIEVDALSARTSSPPPVTQDVQVVADAPWTAPGEVASAPESAGRPKPRRASTPPRVRPTITASYSAAAFAFEQPLTEAPAATVAPPLLDEVADDPVSRESMEEASPALLEPVEPIAKRSLVRFAAIGAFTCVAYLGWCALLDRF